MFHSTSRMHALEEFLLLTESSLKQKQLTDHAKSVKLHFIFFKPTGKFLNNIKIKTQ